MERKPLKRYTPPRMLLIASLALTFAPMWSCGGDKGGDTGQPIPDTDENRGSGTEIEVDPPSIDFGEVDPAAMAEISQAVSLCNRGTADLRIQNHQLRDGDEAFDLSQLESVLVVPEACSSFEVSFSPQAGEVSEDAVVIDCNDEDSDGYPLEISVRGQGLAAR